MRVTIGDLLELKRRGERFAMVTAYDYTSARLAERAGLPLMLVGDSVGTVVQGHDTTVPVTLDHMVYHAQMVVRGSDHAMVVGDLPFMTYASVDDALRSAARLFQEAGVQAVKLEGADEALDVVRALTVRGLPVMGHLGYTPQSVHTFGRQIVRGKTVSQARKLLDDALALQEAGAFAIVLECVPAPLAARVTGNLRVPTIGIGSGPGCDGQVQVWHDLLGLFPDFVPRHAGQYAKLGDLATEALRAYAAEVADGAFPCDKHSSALPEDTMRALLQAVESA
ncbi:MAG: 3-methyl-2-oxobutanoate hydroxymethyltransferase [Armatimonadetes bacterium]|nr:3-methyl-2-oxobutanoate hydroxymethyltransferase [Armatimonadota bacterium]